MQKHSIKIKINIIGLVHKLFRIIFILPMEIKQFFHHLPVYLQKNNIYITNFLQSATNAFNEFSIMKFYKFNLKSRSIKTTKYVHL